MANDYLVCIVRNEALVRKVIIVDPDSIVNSLLERICEEFKIDTNDFDLYFSKPSGMTQLMDSEKMGDIGMSESADARNNFVIIDKPKKRKKQKSVEKPTTESLPKSDNVDCVKPAVCSEFEDMETVTKRTSLTNYSGLQNQGSTCYLNCIIQILFWTPAIRNAVLSWKLFDTDTHPLKCVLIQFQKLCVKLWLSVENSQSTNMLTKCLGIRSVFTQEDAFEKFNWFVSCLETRLNTLKIKDNISPLFIGQQESFLTCRECGTKTSKVEDFSGIMLPIKDSVTDENFGSLARALEAYCTTEVLSDENKCHCMNCGGLKAMEKQLLFKKLPDILNIVLLRFQSVGGINTKLHHRVEYPKSICFKDILSGEQPENRYSLHSAIIHSGSADTGHYLCIVKDTNNRFIRINDQKVEWLTDDDFISSFGRDESGCRVSARSAYILTYHRHGSKNLSPKPIQLDKVQLDAKDVYESYLGDDFKCYVGYKYSHRMVYHSIYTNMLTTLKEVRELGQRSFPACNGKSMRMRWVNSVNNNSLPIFDENMELNEVIKEAPFKKLHFVLEHEDDDAEDFNMNRNVRECKLGIYTYDDLY